MEIGEIIFKYVFLLCVIAWGVWMCHSLKKDFLEKLASSCYIIFPIVLLIDLTIKLLKG